MEEKCRQYFVELSTDGSVYIFDFVPHDVFTQLSWFLIWIYSETCLKNTTNVNRVGNVCVNFVWKILNNINIAFMPLVTSGCIKFFLLKKVIRAVWKKYNLHLELLDLHQVAFESKSIGFFWSKIGNSSALHINLFASAKELLSNNFIFPKGKKCGIYEFF